LFQKAKQLTAVDKKSLSESDICDLYITPAIKGAGWDPMTQSLSGNFMMDCRVFGS
jgi:type I site-specific restriction endonuclease